MTTIQSPRVYSIMNMLRGLEGFDPDTIESIDIDYDLEKEDQICCFSFNSGDNSYKVNTEGHTLLLIMFELLEGRLLFDREYYEKEHRMKMFYDGRPVGLIHIGIPEDFAVFVFEGSEGEELRVDFGETHSNIIRNTLLRAHK